MVCMLQDEIIQQNKMMQQNKVIIGTFSLLFILLALISLYWIWLYLSYSSWSSDAKIVADMEPGIFFVVPISIQNFNLYLRTSRVSLGFSQQVVQVDNGSSLLAGPAEDVVEKRTWPKTAENDSSWLYNRPWRQRRRKRNFSFPGYQSYFFQTEFFRVTFLDITESLNRKLFIFILHK